MRAYVCVCTDTSTSLYIWVYARACLFGWNKRNWPVCGEETSALYLESVWEFPRLCTRKVNSPVNPWIALVHTGKCILIASQTSSVKKGQLRCSRSLEIRRKECCCRRAGAEPPSLCLVPGVRFLGECMWLLKGPSSFHLMLQGFLWDGP